jgi:hypothetical protein
MKLTNTPTYPRSSAFIGGLILSVDGTAIRALSAKGRIKPPMNADERGCRQMVPHATFSHRERLA